MRAGERRDPLQPADDPRQRTDERLQPREHRLGRAGRKHGAGRERVIACAERLHGHEPAKDLTAPDRRVAHQLVGRRDERHRRSHWVRPLIRQRWSCAHSVSSRGR